MKTSIPIVCTAAVLPFLTITVRAQDNAAPAPAAAAVSAQSEMQKWLTTTDAQWQATYNREVVDVHAAELKKLAAQYGVSIEAAINKASGAGDLDGAVALRNEQKRFADTNTFSDQDEEGDAASVKQIRAATRTQLAKLKAGNAARVRALHAKYDQVLAQAQTQLTQRKRLDDALLVKAKRDEVTAAWLAGIPAAPAPAVAEQPKPQPPPPAPAIAVAAEIEKAGANLFKNPNFENGIEGWEYAAFDKKGSIPAIEAIGSIAVDKTELHHGKPTLRIELHTEGFVFMRQSVGKPNSRYRLTGYIKTKNVESVKKGKNEGARLMIGFPAEIRESTTTALVKTNPWKKVSLDIVTTAKSEIKMGPGLGYYNSNVTGTAWFSEMSLVEIGPNAKK